MPPLEDVDVSEQLDNEPSTRLVIEEVTETEEPDQPEDIPLLKPKHLQEEPQGIFSSKSESLCTSSSASFFNAYTISSLVVKLLISLQNKYFYVEHFSGLNVFFCIL